MDTFQLVELLAVDFDVRAEEVEVCPERLPLAFLFHLLLSQLVAFAFVNMNDIDFHVLTSARQIGEDRGPLAEVPYHVTADIAADDGARQRILEQDLYHLFY